VIERRCAVALAHHCREIEGPPFTEIARHVGRSAATIHAYFYDSGEKAWAVKTSTSGCGGCGANTRPCNRKADADAYGKRCHPGRSSNT
jgi:hypothetical protein